MGENAATYEAELSKPGHIPGEYVMADPTEPTLVPDHDIQPDTTEPQPDETPRTDAVPEDDPGTDAVPPTTDDGA